MTTKGCRRMRVIRKPWMEPSTTPSDDDQQRRATRAAARSTRRSTKITPSRAKIEPIDRSMPPVMMTKPSPIENSPNRPIRLAVLARLIGEMKRGLMMRDDGAHDQDQNEQAEIFFQHARSPLPEVACRQRAA